MIHVTRTRLRSALTEADIRRLSAAFSSEHFLRLPGFFASDILTIVEGRLPAAAFRTRIEQGRAIEDTIEEPSLVGLFTLVLNDPALFSVVSRLTACGPIGCFTGRLYRRRASRSAGAQYYPWHNDVSDDRLIGLSINLGSSPHQGGVLQFREARTGRPIVDIENTGHGDAILFRVSEALEHQVTPVVGDVPRTVMAGWFRARPSYLELVAEATGQARQDGTSAPSGPSGRGPRGTAYAQMPLKSPETRAGKAYE